MDVVLEEAGVSRVHARIFEQAGRCFVEDLQSFNGTKVNGKKIAGPTELADGDSIAVGQVVFAFVAPAKVAKVLEGPPTVLMAQVTLDDEPTAAAPPPVPEAPEEVATLLAAPAMPEFHPPDEEGTPAPASLAELETNPAVGLHADDRRTDPRSKAPAFVQETVIVERSSKPPRPIAGAETRILDVPAAVPPPATATGTDTRILDQPPAAEISTGTETRILDQPPAAAILAATETRILEAMVPTGPVPLAPLTRVSAGKPKPKPLTAPASAVERARARREANESLGKLLAFHWRELSPRGRIVSGGIAGALVLSALVAVAVAFWPKERDDAPKGPEPTELSATPIPDSFGLGDGVTWQHADRKSFDFYFTAPTRAVAVLHYQAKGISPDEVTIAVNGVLVDPVPADTANSDEREIQQVIPSRLLKRNVTNTVIFDNVHNPPGEDGWMIWNPWIEVIPIPELPADQLMAQAREFAQKGKQFYDQRDVGSANLFRAWKAYRDSWLTLEAVDRKSELYPLVRYQLMAIGKELDQQCGRMMLAARKAIELHQRPKAKQALEEVNAYFPTAEHRCHNLAIEKLNQYDL